MNNFIVPFIPVIDERDGRLIYIAEPFIIPPSFINLIVVMPFEFSITLEDVIDSPLNPTSDPSSIVKLTFWDLLETFPVFHNAHTFIIFHDSELDEIGKELQGLSHKFWGAMADPLLDSIHLSRRFYSFLKNRPLFEHPIFRKKILKECLDFHRRNGIVELDENDPVERPFFNRVLAERRLKYQKNTHLLVTIKKVESHLEKKAQFQAATLWDSLSTEGKILYYPPGNYPPI
ncbi:MAG: hypothetical protein ACTSRS_01820 [Candidatus Helarchaeota archaeon]